MDVGLLILGWLAGLVVIWFIWLVLLLCGSPYSLMLRCQYSTALSYCWRSVKICASVFNDASVYDPFSFAFC